MTDILVASLLLIAYACAQYCIAYTPSFSDLWKLVVKRRRYGSE